jgi:hypothetical protein
MRTEPEYTATDIPALVARLDDLDASFCEFCDGLVLFGWDRTPTGEVRLCRTCERCGVIEATVVTIRRARRAPKRALPPLKTALNRR